MLEPLDLRIAPPRPPREKLAGLVFLPRTIDKLRATLPGGNTGAYWPYEGLSALFARLTGIDLFELRDVVAHARSEQDVEAWFAARVDDNARGKTNHVMERVSVQQVTPELRERFEAVAPAHMRESYPNLFDLLEADDRLAFQGVAEG